MEKNKKFFKKKWVIIGIILGLLCLSTVIVILKKLPPRLPDDGKHRETRSNFVCTGCHNNANKGGTSLLYHFDGLNCVKCHRL